MKNRHSQMLLACVVFLFSIQVLASDSEIPEAIRDFVISGLSATKRTDLDFQPNYDSDPRIGFLRATSKLISQASDNPEYRSSTTRQIPNANALYKKCSKGVVLLVAPDGSALGSGSLTSAEGEIITNWHVVANSDSMYVFFYNPNVSQLQDLAKSSYAIGYVVASQPEKDLALIKVNVTRNIEPLVFGILDDISIADDVFAIGHPDTYVWTFTYGVISQIRRNFSWKYADDHTFKANVIQTQTPSNPGNSGGPLFDAKGKLVGINTFSSKNSQGLNFAVQVDEIQTFRVKAHSGKYRHVSKPKLSEVNSEESDWTPYDANEDGIIDVYARDTNGDGIYDIYQVDDDQDGILDYYAYDLNSDGKVDTWSYDLDNDGIFEYFLSDSDFDGKLDTIGIDSTGDGIPDEFDAYTEG